MSVTLLIHLTNSQAANVNLPPGSTCYIKNFDVNAFGGIGEAELTSESAEAMTWPTFALAMAAWQSQSTVRPIRGDGQPNKPLTAYTVEVIHL